ncbi:phage GP46 family protein [Luteimonas soli]|uniref:Phage GP46 family protein n=1 Tax=Luteimonas soli TaxID=1648966 RepID=A0ABV7XP75_9GAMM
MDLRTRISADGLTADWLLGGMQLAVDDGLETAITLSLFTDRLADAGDVLPAGSEHRRGWWGDSFAEFDGDLIGSRLWLLAREKQLPVVLQRARDYARESLRWLVDDGIARNVEADAQFVGLGVLALTVTVERAVAGPVRFRFEIFWGTENAV